MIGCDWEHVKQLRKNMFLCRAICKHQKNLVPDRYDTQSRSRRRNLDCVSSA